MWKHIFLVSSLQIKCLAAKDVSGTVQKLSSSGRSERDTAAGAILLYRLVSKPPCGHPVWIYVCMYVCMVITYCKSMNQPGKVANPARGQLNRENEHFPVPVRA